MPEPPPAPARRTAAEAEDVAQDVGEVGEDRGIEPAEAAGAAHALVAEAVVARPLLGVGEHRVGLGGLLEALLGLLVAGVLVRVVLCTAILRYADLISCWLGVPPTPSTS